MSKDFELSDRKRQLLLSAVESYIESALPITSGNVQSTFFQSLSSATLRNELSALEEMGYLKQLHTSSGRIPTTKAYRYYVNNLITSRPMDAKMLDDIRDKFTNRSTFLVEMLDGLAKKIGDLVHYPTFVMMKGSSELYISAINIIPLITGQALVLLQTNAGIINNTMDLPSGITDEHCKDASKFLTNNLSGKKIVDVLSNYDYYNQLFKNQINYYNDLFVAITNMLKNFSDHTTGFVTHGTATKLLDEPEYKDVSKAKKFLNIVENEQQLRTIIDNIDENSNQDIVFSIGEENGDDTCDYSIVKANYHMADGITASFGVVGPERMDYAKIASALKFVVDEMSAMDKLGGNNGRKE